MQMTTTTLSSLTYYLLTNSQVSLRLHYKTHGKCFIVYYLVMDAPGRITKLTRTQGFSLLTSPACPMGI